MTSSLIFAWTAVLLTVLETLRVAARLSGVKALDRFFHRLHIPLGVGLIAVGGIHGALAGNMPGTPLPDAAVAPVLFTLNWGTACFLLSILLAVSYLLRRRLKKSWMPVHRVLTGLMLLTLVLHVANVGVQLPGRLFPDASAGGTPPPAVSAPDPSKAPDPTRAPDPSASAPSATPSDTPSDTPAVTFSGAVLRDGTYEGSAAGYRGTITVRATVENGQVTDLTVVRHSDTPQYFSAAGKVITAILSGQSLEVDAVSGATYSSEGIKNAACAALEQAVESGELRITHVSVTSGKHRH